MVPSPFASRHARTTSALALSLGLAACSGPRASAPATGPFRLSYDGPQHDAHEELVGALAAARFAVSMDDADRGLVRTAPRPLHPDERPAGASAGPDTAEVWFRLAQHPSGRTVLAARPLLAITVPRDPEDPGSAPVPLLAEVAPDHPLARHVLGRLTEAGFSLLPPNAAWAGRLDLSTEVYDGQP